jgi:hypothetical protein
LRTCVDYVARSFFLESLRIWLERLMLTMVLLQRETASLEVSILLTTRDTEFCLSGLRESKSDEETSAVIYHTEGKRMVSWLLDHALSDNTNVCQ